MADEKNQSVMLPVDIEVEMRKSYLDYAMSVIVARAIPDVRDGLKPVQRRILVAMNDLGLASNRGYRKCAKICGDTSGNYHPHGEAVIYPTLVRLAQPFVMRYSLVDGQGNYGSVDGDPPAAMRYTEARLARITEEMLADLEKETVDFVPNFDQTREEPVVLPAKVPNLLINGASGIAVGMATNIPPHNLREVIDATIFLLEKPDASLKELMKIVPGPDFPTGGYISGREGILQAYKTGRGTFLMRAKAAIEQKSKDREDIVITEIPYQVNKARLVEQVATLVNDKKIEGISDIRDESDRDGLRVVIELKRGEQPEIVLNNLYKLTQMQVNFGVIMLSIVNGQPRELGLIDCIKRFIDHRVEVVRRRTEFLLAKAREREHILLGFQKALQNLDAVIETVRASRNPKEAREGLMGVTDFPENAKLAAVIAKWAPALKHNGLPLSRFDFSEKQAQAIIELQLQRLTGMEQQKVLDELAEIERMIAGYLEILNSDARLRAIIVSELKDVQKSFGDPRRTQIVDDEGEINIEDLIKMEDVVVTVTRGGYLKRTALDTYRRQSRGGKGRIGMTTRSEDVVEHMLSASTHSYLLIFTNKGRLYWLKVYNIPDAGSASKGKNINQLISLQEDESIKAFLPVKEFTPDQFVVMATKFGVIKKCELVEFDNPMSRGIIAIGLKTEDDELISAKLSTGSDLIFIATHNGMAIKFLESDVRAMGRPAAGVASMRLGADDSIVAMEVVSEDSLILSIAENGMGKRTPASHYRLQSRAGKGVINMKVSKRTGPVVNVLEVKEDTDVVVITRNGQIIRTEAAQIRKTGRSAQGVKLVTLEPGDVVAAACSVQETEIEGEDTGDIQTDLPLV